MLHLGLRPPYSLLIVAAIFLVFGVAATITGESRSRWGRVISRAKNPEEFWQDVTTFYLCGFLLIADYVYKAYGLSN